ncbi:uncharacterized protein LOC127855797 [Dreissena polymorpha]|uniref:Uncharacterized protein n=1 Tax=Dreissena polymorpha TaxID=45954 RepID=A0A9D4CD29_DREPO|nr:uncharacterized protein LOC127855797 [Dreissena polymorpha]KAH3721943.1 hypothetical protein DPMN_064892 [Dreissena polymorpha]
MAGVLIASIFIGFIHSASTQGSYFDSDHYYYRGYVDAIAIGAIALSFSSLSLICIFVGLICICAKKCCRQPPPAAPSVAFVNAVPGVMQYGQPLTHDHPMMHNQPAMHCQPPMYSQRQ